MRPSAAVPPHETPSSSSCALASPSRSILTVRCRLRSASTTSCAPRSVYHAPRSTPCCSGGVQCPVTSPRSAPVACDGSETGEISDEHPVHAGKQMEQATR